MTIKTIASISITWDEFGRLSHSLNTFIPADDYQKADALGLSVPLVTTSQLGVLTPRHSLDLCGHALNFLSEGRQVHEVIQYPLSAARIDLIQKDRTIVSTFHPTFLEGGTMEPEESVRRLVSNYLSHVNSAISSELSGYMKATILMSVSFYLSKVLPRAQKRLSFSRDTANTDIQLTMLAFCESIFPEWQGGPSLPPARFASNLLDAKRNYQTLRTRT